MEGHLDIAPGVRLDLSEVEFHAVRARGPGGQHVNKAATAVQLRFDIPRSSLPEPVKQRLLALRDHRITKDGVLVIKAQTHRSQHQNREEALQRLADLVRGVLSEPPRRVWTRPGRRAHRRRLEEKAHRAAVKRLRRRVLPE